MKAKLTTRNIRARRIVRIRLANHGFGRGKTHRDVRNTMTSTDAQVGSVWIPGRMINSFLSTNSRFYNFED